MPNPGAKIWNNKPFQFKVDLNNLPQPISHSILIHSVGHLVPASSVALKKCEGRDLED